MLAPTDPASAAADDRRPSEGVSSVNVWVAVPEREIGASALESETAVGKIGGVTANAKTTATDSFGEIATVRIELRDTNPVIWREVQVPTSVTLKVLHDIIQAVMGWFDSHLWEFTIAKQRYGLPMDEDWGTAPRVDAAKVCLRDVLQPRKTTIDYLYDFGDSWEHRLTVTAIRRGEPGIGYPRYIGGEWNAPPEDCGGIIGFYESLDAIADPKHPNHAEAVEWFDEYDSKTVDELGIKSALSRIANRLNAAAARHAKRKSAPNG
jgi:hypothetical protein